MGLSMFNRVSNAVIAPNLVRDLNLDAKSLGMLGGAFFYSFALLQIPMGILLDRIGPQLLIPVFTLFGASGAFIFASSQTFAIALLGRVLIGAGMSCVLMGSLKVFVLRFSPKQFATIAGTFISVGMLGSILATSPLAYATITIGWRMAFVGIGAIMATFACLAFWILKGGRDQEKSGPLPPNPDQGIAMSKVVKLVLGNLSFWQIGTLSFFGSGSFLALLGLWLGPYLIQIKGFPAVQAGNILMMLPIGVICGAPVAGYLADRVFRSAKMAALCGIGTYTLFLIPLTGILEITTPVFYSVLFFIIGFFNGFVVLSFSHVKELFPLRISATVIAGINFFAMAGGAILMPVLGKVIEIFTIQGSSDASRAYHLAFLICFIGMAASLIFYVFSKDRK